MDGKLARGFTNEGFRKDFKPAPERGKAMASRILEFTRLLSTNSVSKSYVEEFIDWDMRTKATPHELLFIDKHKNPGRPSLTQHTECSLTGGYFIPARGTINGNDEKWRHYVKFHERLSRTKLDSRSTMYPTLIREHALKRFIERDGGNFFELTSALWPGILVLEVLDLVAPNRDHPFVIPSSGGLFLGTTTWEVWAKPPSVHHWTIERHGQQEASSPLFVGMSPSHKINTYVSANETSHDQDRLRDAIMRFITANLDPLKALHVMDVLRFSTPADSAIVANLMPESFEHFRAECIELVRSELWRRQVRWPRE